MKKIRPKVKDTVTGELTADAQRLKDVLAQLLSVKVTIGQLSCGSREIDIKISFDGEVVCEAYDYIPSDGYDPVY